MQLEDLEKDLLKIGSIVPNSDVQIVGGRRVKVLELIKPSRISIVNFWFLGCGGCMEELPELQKIYAKVGAKSLGILPINRGDKAADIQTYWRKQKYSFAAIMAENKVHDAYQAYAYPTNYIVDAKGKILSRMIGYDHKRLVDALKKAGLRL